MPLLGLTSATASRALRSGGSDGLDIQRRIAASSAPWLSLSGCLLVETGLRQAPQTAAIFAWNGLLPRIVRSEELESTIFLGVAI